MKLQPLISAALGKPWRSEFVACWKITLALISTPAAFGTREDRARHFGGIDAKRFASSVDDQRVELDCRLEVARFE